MKFSNCANSGIFTLLLCAVDQCALSSSHKKNNSLRKPTEAPEPGFKAQNLVDKEVEVDNSYS